MKKKIPLPAVLPYQYIHLLMDLSILQGKGFHKTVQLHLFQTLYISSEYTSTVSLHYSL